MSLSLRHRSGKQWVFPLALVALSCISWFIYAPGLRGSFLFDDFVNLPTLGQYGPVENARTFWLYLTSGTADPTGRPLALLSFLLDARNWPADPYPFKRTNVLLHLANGALLAAWLRQLGRVQEPARAGLRNDLAALLGSALWVLHPLFVSTTLYVVQREAMLPATFALLGLIGYGHGRSLAAQGRAHGVLLCAASISVCTLLAMASKANGVLLPLFAWLADTLLLAPSLPIGDERIRARFMWMRRLVVVAPSLLVLAWLAKQGAHYALDGVPNFRTWTLAQRLLTEARVLCSYLAELWLPHPYTSGLFNDHYPISRGLISPPATLLAMTAIAVLIAAAYFLRRLAPPLAFAIAFYLTGHLLESTVIPLDLYYEHRNYLPALPMFWPLALWLLGEGPAQPVRRVLVGLLPLLFGTMTWMHAGLWGNSAQQIALWAEKNPRSARAQAYAAGAERERGRPDLAIARLRSIRLADQDDLPLVLNLIGAECEMGGADPRDIERADTALRSVRITGKVGYDWLNDAISRVAQGQPCPGLGAEQIRRLIGAAESNPYNSDSAGRRQDHLSLRGSLALAQGDAAGALDYFDRALDAKPLPAPALEQAARLGRAGHAAEGLRHLDRRPELFASTAPRSMSMASLHAWLLEQDGYWQREAAHLRDTLRKDSSLPAAATTAKPLDASEHHD